MGHFYKGRSFISCLTVCSVVIFRTTGGGSVTWFEPPPSETVTDPLSITAANESLVKGSLNGELSCNFSLSADLSIITVSMHFGGSPVANFAQSQQALSVAAGFENRVNVTWVPYKLTLIFFQVTSADEGEFRCNVLTLRSPGAVIQTWKRKIQVSLFETVLCCDASVTPQTICHPSRPVGWKCKLDSTLLGRLNATVPSEILAVAGKTVIEGENVTLKCLAEGKPKPTITWTRLSDNSVVTMPLINISRNSETDFKCTANNGIGTPAIRKVSLDVQYAVEPTGSGENVTWVDGGKNYSFSCPVDGNPQPNITWYKAGDVGGSKISSGKHLTNLTVTGDSEEHLCYTCVASNPLGTPVHITQCLLIEHATVPSKSPPVAISEGPPWIVIGIVAGIGVFMVIAVGLAVWWMCKKRKRRKETKQGELRHLEVDHVDNGERLE